MDRTPGRRAARGLGQGPGTGEAGGGERGAEWLDMPWRVRAQARAGPILGSPSEPRAPVWRRGRLCSLAVSEVNLWRPSAGGRRLSPTHSSSSRVPAPQQARVLGGGHEDTAGPLSPGGGVARPSTGSSSCSPHTLRGWVVCFYPLHGLLFH